MAIKVSGTTVIDNDRNINVGIVTATTIDMPPTPITFSPADGSSDNNVDTNIVITYNVNISKGTGNITLRDGSASGTVIETIDVTSGAVSISGGQATINPTSNLSTGKNVYVVIDAGAFKNSRLGTLTKLLETYNFTTGSIVGTTFSPADGASNVVVTSNIVITFGEDITKSSSGNITIRSGSASGTVQQTISVTSGAVTVSGTQATINPPSDLAYLTDTYIVVDADCFRNSNGDEASGNAVINTYNFTTENSLNLGDSYEGGYLICCSSNTYWIVSPSSTEVCRSWYCRNDSNIRANQVSGCAGWFVPSCAQLKNPGYTCRTHWDSHDGVYGNINSYWSNTGYTTSAAWGYNFTTGENTAYDKPYAFPIRSFRCVAY